MSKKKTALKRKPAARTSRRELLADGLKRIHAAAAGAAAQPGDNRVITVGAAPTLEQLLKLHPLARVFEDALAQATRGKGNARHGQGRDSVDAENFLRQDWRAIAVRHGPAFLSGQAEKKLREALALPHPERRTELLGVLVYVAMLVVHHDKGGA